MTAAEKLNLTSVDDYLAGELVSPTKHEYLEGVVYAMAAETPNLTIPSLWVYAIVEQETAAVVVHRRTEHGFVREVYEGQGAVIPLPEIETELPLAEIYDGVEFSPESPVEDDL